MLPTEKELLIWMNHLGNISFEMIRRMADYFGSMEEIWTAKENHIYEAMGKHNITAGKIIENRNRQLLNKWLEKLNKYSFHILTISDAEYPQKLRGLYNPPYVMYVSGKRSFNIPLIAMVGTRKASPYGRWAAHKFSKELAQWGIGVISGMASGIDTAAHKGALEEKGYTAAVLGCGMDVCYPASNKALMEEIAHKGCIITEYPPGVLPLKQNFPARNRIISGLSEGIIVIEAGERSGALITVEFGLEQGKDIYALPGNINSSQSRGTNKLISEGAKMLLCIEDVIEELKFKYNILKNEKEEALLSPAEEKIYSIIKEQPLHIDYIAYKSGLKISELSSVLTVLELKGYIIQLQGKIFTVNK